MPFISPPIINSGYCAMTERFVSTFSKNVNLYKLLQSLCVHFPLAPRMAVGNHPQNLFGFLPRLSFRFFVRANAEGESEDTILRVMSTGCKKNSVNIEFLNENNFVNWHINLVSTAF